MYSSIKNSTLTKVTFSPNKLHGKFPSILSKHLETLKHTGQTNKSPPGFTK